MKQKVGLYALGWPIILGLMVIWCYYRKQMLFWLPTLANKLMWGRWELLWWQSKKRKTIHVTPIGVNTRVQSVANKVSRAKEELRLGNNWSIGLVKFRHQNYHNGFKYSGFILTWDNAKLYKMLLWMCSFKWGIQ